MLERPFKCKKEGRFYATPLVISPRVGAHNARVMFPEMGQRCGFCRECHHTYTFGRAQVACPHAHATLSHDGGLSHYPHCQYVRCEIQHHHTRVCPTLHALCTLCDLRGHVGGCSTDPKWVAGALSDFEAVADEGMYMSRRHLEARWGFYPSYGTSAEPSYSLEVDGSCPGIRAL